MTDDQLLTNIPATAIRESWESIHQKTLELARIITEHCQQTGEQFDKMVVVPRGSYYPANIISRELGFKAPDLLHACVGSYESATTERNESFQLGQMPTAAELTGKDLLIIEEVCDTGSTLAFLVDYLLKNGAKSVKVGVLHEKPGRSVTGFKPDWVVVQTDEWIVYPWEANERRGMTSTVRRQSA